MVLAKHKKKIIKSKKFLQLIKKVKILHLKVMFVDIMDGNQITKENLFL